MKTFKARREAAKRIALDLLPAADRPPVVFQGARRRECGGCVACCHVQKIVQLDKPMLADCPHQCAAGCDLHGTGLKPHECHVYSCLWALGALTGGDAERPDKLGLFVDMRQDTYGNGSWGLVVWEVRPGAALEAWDFIGRLVSQQPRTYLVPYGSPTRDDGNGAANICLGVVWRDHGTEDARKAIVRDAIDTLLREAKPC